MPGTSYFPDETEHWGSHSEKIAYFEGSKNPKRLKTTEALRNF